ncbi:MAG: lipopolysaccharide chain length-determining protein [Spirochaetales bacterium]|nr:lipopolysaccharide chain length-determining protein [Spirochaetales bacterium]
MNNERVDEIEIDLFSLWKAIRKNLVLILLLAVVLAGVGFGVSKLLPKKYSTFTTMLLGRPEEYTSVSQDGIRIDDVNLNQKLIGTYGEFIKSRNVTMEVIENLGLDMTYEQMKSKVNVNRLKDTEMISIEVTDTIPLRAKDIANEMADIFRVKIAEALKINNIQIVDYAIVPNNPVSPKLRRNTALGGMLGLFLGVSIVVLKAILDTSIKTADDITEYLGLPVLGMIPRDETVGRRKK